MGGIAAILEDIYEGHVKSCLISLE
jgi:hypothetical protein